VFHPAPVIFKGSGFYVTDSRHGAGGDGGGGGGDGSDGGGGSDNVIDSPAEKSASAGESTGVDG
jgi:hypothetical protein